jgi:hypothetical protein
MFEAYYLLFTIESLVLRATGFHRPALERQNDKKRTWRCEKIAVTLSDNRLSKYFGTRRS